MIARLSTPCLSLLFFICLNNGTLGSLITTLDSSVTSTPEGTFLYQYTLTTSSASTLPAIELSITVPADTHILSIAGPVDWIVTYTAGDTIVDWASPTPFSDLLPGQSKVFVLESSFSPVAQNYFVLGLDDMFNVDINTGITIGPGNSVASVPEPTYAMIFCSLLTFILWQLKVHGASGD